MNFQEMIEQHPGLAIGGAVIIGVGVFVLAGRGGSKVIPATPQTADQSAGTSAVGADALAAALAAQQQQFQTLLDQQAQVFYQTIYGTGSGQEYTLPGAPGHPGPQGDPGPTPISGDGGGSGGRGIYHFTLPNYKAAAAGMVLN